jgi:NAD dependent epimerase/dehydratase family enzyme
VPTPPLALRVMLGEVGSVIATGQRVLPERALALGYQFRFPSLNAALADILG